MGDQNAAWDLLTTPGRFCKLKSRIYSLIKHVVYAEGILQGMPVISYNVMEERRQEVLCRFGSIW